MLLALASPELDVRAVCTMAGSREGIQSFIRVVWMLGPQEIFGPYNLYLKEVFVGGMKLLEVAEFGMV